MVFLFIVSNSRDSMDVSDETKLSQYYPNRSNVFYRIIHLSNFYDEPKMFFGIIPLLQLSILNYHHKVTLTLLGYYFSCEWKEVIMFCVLYNLLAAFAGFIPIMNTAPHCLLCYSYCGLQLTELVQDQRETFL